MNGDADVLNEGQLVHAAFVVPVLYEPAGQAEQVVAPVLYRGEVEVYAAKTSALLRARFQM